MRHMCPWRQTHHSGFGFYRLPRLSCTDVYLFLTCIVPVLVLNTCCQWLVTKLFSIWRMVLERRTMASWSYPLRTWIILPKDVRKDLSQTILLGDKNGKRFMHSRQFRFKTQSHHSSHFDCFSCGAIATAHFERTRTGGQGNFGFTVVGDVKALACTCAPHLNVGRAHFNEKLAINTKSRSDCTGAVHSFSCQ